MDSMQLRSQESRRRSQSRSRPPAILPRSTLPLVTGIRHWSTPDYTRVAIDLEQEVKYEAGRVSNPDRIFFDLHDTKLASTLVGKTFEVSDGFLRRVRIAQFQKGMVRVVLEVDAVSDYSAFLASQSLSPDHRYPRTQAQRAADSWLPVPSRKRRSVFPRLRHRRRPSRKDPLQQPTYLRPCRTLRTQARLRNRRILRRKPWSSLGRRMADGSFFSHPSSALADNEKICFHCVTPTAAHGRDLQRLPQSSLCLLRIASRSPPSPRSPISRALNSRLPNKPTSEPTVQVVAPRGSGQSCLTSKKTSYPEIRQAQPTADGQRSLIRALGLKVGRIVIDAGHGGHDTGTIGPNGLLEKDLVLDVSLRLGRLLQTQDGCRGGLHPRRRHIHSA